MSDRAASRVRRPPEARRAAIAAAAKALALDAGLMAVTQRGVAAASEVAPALVAHYASGMHGLVADTFGAIVMDELREVEALVASVPDARGRLRALLATLLDGSRDDVTLVWVQAWAMGARNEVLAGRVREAMDAWQALIGDVIERGVEVGDWPGVDAREAAWVVLGMIDGLTAQSLVRWRGRGGARDGTADERVALVARAVEGVLGVERGALG